MPSIDPSAQTDRPLPADRAHVRTEHRHPGSERFDLLPSAEQVELVVEDHAQVLLAVRAAGPALVAMVGDLVPRMRGGGRLVYVGAGTSGRLGVLDASECVPTFRAEPGQVVGIIAGGDTALRRSAEGAEDDPSGAAGEFDRLTIGARDFVLGIAAGGTTAYVLGALALAKERGAGTGLLACATPQAAPAVDHLLVLDTGPEIVTGSTRLKAGSATKLALNILTTVAFTQLGKVYGNLMVDLMATNEKLTDRALRILRTIDPSLGRAEASERLDAGGGSVKTAIVMHLRRVSRAEAESLLASSNGDLRRIIG